MKQKLILTAGLPGSGKSTIAEFLARELAIAVVSIDPIEAAMWRSGFAKDTTGIAAYTVARAIAEEQLKLGQSVIVDAVNPVEVARESWRSLAQQYQVVLVIIECICSDVQIHQQRIEARKRNIPGMDEVTWEMVELRRQEYEPWQDARLVLDTSGDLRAMKAKALDFVGRISLTDSPA